MKKWIILSFSALMLAFTADGRTLVAAGNDGIAAVFDVPTRTFRRTFQIHQSRVWGLTLSPDGKTFASASGMGDPTVKLWDADSVPPLRTFSGHSNSVQGAVFAMDGHTLVSGLLLEPLSNSGRFITRSWVSVGVKLVESVTLTWKDS